MLSSDVFVSMMSANIAAAILSVDLTGGTRTIILILTIVLGYGLKIAKRITVEALGSEDNNAEVLFEPLVGLISMVVLGIIFLVIFKIMGY